MDKTTWIIQTSFSRFTLKLVEEKDKEGNNIVRLWDGMFSENKHSRKTFDESIEMLTEMCLEDAKRRKIKPFLKVTGISTYSACDIDYPFEDEEERKE